MHLTYHDSDEHTNAVLPASAGEAGAPEIVEVTDEMLERGSHALEDHYLGDGVYDLTYPTLRKVFLEMLAAMPKSARRGNYALDIP